MNATNSGLQRVLPPHPSPNMLNSFMTQYDYSYNCNHTAANVGDSGSKDDIGISGEVRSRPLFRLGLSMGKDNKTTYDTDYVQHDRRTKDLSGLVKTACGEHDVASAFVRDSYRPSLTNHRTEDGSHPCTTYKADYTHSGRVPKGEPQLYAGARTAAFNPNFLLIPVTEEDRKAEAELAPKITSKESLLPKIHSSTNGNHIPKEDLLASRRPQLTTGGSPTEYYCTSWVYGDKDLAYPSQLPCSIEESPNAHLIGVMEDKAALLALLAGKRKVAGKSYPMYDDTNPIPIQKNEQPFCAVTRRIENEGHVKMSMYKSDYINQAMLPELPDAVTLAGRNENGAGGNPQLACAGEMSAGTLTQSLRKYYCLRNSHGNLLKHKPDSSVVDPYTWKHMKLIEKCIDVDKIDPHRHKLH